MWQYLPSKGLRFWMSGPVDIVVRLWNWVLDGSLWENLGATLLAMVLGYMIGTAVGIALGLLFGLMPRAASRSVAVYHCAVCDAEDRAGAAVRHRASASASNRRWHSSPSPYSS